MRDLPAGRSRFQHEQPIAVRKLNFVRFGLKPTAITTQVSPEHRLGMSPQHERMRLEGGYAPIVIGAFDTGERENLSHDLTTRMPLTVSEPPGDGTPRAAP